MLQHSRNYKEIQTSIIIIVIIIIMIIMIIMIIIIIIINNWWKLSSRPRLFKRWIALFTG